MLARFKHSLLPEFINVMGYSQFAKISVNGRIFLFHDSILNSMHNPAMGAVRTSSVGPIRHVPRLIPSITLLPTGSGGYRSWEPVTGQSLEQARQLFSPVRAKVAERILGFIGGPWLESAESPFRRRLIYLFLNCI